MLNIEYETKTCWEHCLETKGRPKISSESMVDEDIKSHTLRFQIVVSVCFCVLHSTAFRNLMSNILEYLRKNVCLGPCFDCLIQIQIMCIKFTCFNMWRITHTMYIHIMTQLHIDTHFFEFSKSTYRQLGPFFWILKVWLASSLAMRKSVAPSDPRGHQSKSENQRTTDQDWKCLTHVKILHYAMSSLWVLILWSSSYSKHKWWVFQCRMSKSNWRWWMFVTWHISWHSMSVYTCHL